MLSSRLLTGLVLGCAVLAGGCDRETGEKAQPRANASATRPAPATGVIDRSHRGAKLPDFTLRDPSGKQLRLASRTGKPLLINLWATWCAPCIAELPTLDRLAKERAGALTVLTVSQDSGDPAKVAAFLAERNLDRLEPWLDPENNLPFHYGTGTLPTTIYYDAQGREVWRIAGERDWSNAETAALLAEAQ